MDAIKRYCLATDLKNEANLIAEYDAYHREIWPEIKKSILDAGILDMEIYRIQNRLFMIMEVGPQFSFEAKNKADEANPKVQEWESLMWHYQQGLPFADPGVKWMLMDCIFKL